MLRRGALTLQLSAAGALAVAALHYWFNSRKPDDSLISSRRTLLHNKYNKTKLTHDYDYIIIGSGMSGLSCATILARCGYRVLVLEQHPDTAGGGSHTFELGKFKFDSGLHYTVPWSGPIFALTTGKRIDKVCPFSMMGDDGDTVDKIFLHRTDDGDSSDLRAFSPFEMKTGERHMQRLYELFPEERAAIDKYLVVSNNAMQYVKIFIALRLLPKWMQSVMWRFVVPTSIVASANVTAEELLPTLTTNKLLISLLSSMWIDTGARPDKASFMLTASVFRGISMEGGAYPANGSESMAEELVPEIERWGGQVLIRAAVKEIIVEESRAVGVRMNDEERTVISCRKGVVSSCGYYNTFTKLISDRDLLSRHGILSSDLGVEQSAGFVMCNIGIDSSPEAIGVTNTNTWHVPIDDQNDIFPPLRQSFELPLDSKPKEISAFITFPSMKDRKYKEANPNRVSCQMLVMMNYDLFEKYKGLSDTDRNDGYDNIKNVFKIYCLDIFLHYFPKAADKISVCDVSTPLTIERYLKSINGAAVGLDVTPKRFNDPIIREELDPVTKIGGLYLTGQDTMLCGVTLCQLAGVVTAFRILGLKSALYILYKSIFLSE